MPVTITDPGKTKYFLDGSRFVLGGTPMAARTPTISQLRELVQRASRENPHLTTRLEKAAFLVLLRPLVLVGEDHYRVGAEDGLRDYAVDYLRHGAGHNCKHRLALALSQALGCGEAAPPGQAAIGKSIVRTAVD